MQTLSPSTLAPNKRGELTERRLLNCVRISIALSSLACLGPHLTFRRKLTAGWSRLVAVTRCNWPSQISFSGAAMTMLKTRTSRDVLDFYPRFQGRHSLGLSKEEPNAVVRRRVCGSPKNETWSDQLGKCHCEPDQSVSFYNCYLKLPEI